ncbi:MAG: hypothetical protein ACI9GW_001211 [Halieaceae bacterium]|jgi:uncharacterized protein YggE
MNRFAAIVNKSPSRAGRSLYLLALVGCLLSCAVTRANDSEEVAQIHVSGEGSVEVVPDIAMLNLAVVSEERTANAALESNSRAMGKVVAAMQNHGIAERDMQTTNFSIQPRYVYPPQKANGNREPRQLVGYTVRNGLTVKVRNIDDVGTVLDQSITLGVNEGGKISFGNDTPSSAISKARVAAVKDAMAKAKTLAGAAGVKLGKLLEMSEQSSAPGPQPMARMMMDRASSAESVPVMAGENTYRVMVNLSYAIEQ